MAEKTNAWTVNLHGWIRGPLTDGQLRQLAKTGQINPDTAIRNGQNGRWVRGRDIKRLFDPELSANTVSTDLSPSETARPNSPVSALYGGLPQPQLTVETSRNHKSIPTNWMLKCPVCSRRVSQTAEACPKCGHKLTAETIDKMKSAKMSEVWLVNAILVGGAVLVALMLLILASMPGGGRRSYSPADDYIRNRDEWVHGRASRYMSSSEYNQAKETLDYLNSQGYSDSEIGTAIDSELEYRGE